MQLLARCQEGQIAILAAEDRVFKALFTIAHHPDALSMVSADFFDLLFIDAIGRITIRQKKLETWAIYQQTYEKLQRAPRFELIYSKWQPLYEYELQVNATDPEMVFSVLRCFQSFAKFDAAWKLHLEVW